jgi:hypothetical protein
MVVALAGDYLSSSSTNNLLYINQPVNIESVNLAWGNLSELYARWEIPGSFNILKDLSASGQ